MRRGIDLGLPTAIVLALALVAGDSPVVAQSATNEPSAREQARATILLHNNPVEIPEPKAVTVAARPVARGEIAIFDPIAILVAPARTPVGRVALPDPLEIAIGPARQPVASLELPEPAELPVTAGRDLPEPRTLTAPLAMSTVVERTELPPPVLAEPVKLPTLSGHRQFEALALHDPNQIVIRGTRQFTELTPRDPDELVVSGTRQFTGLELRDPDRLVVSTTRLVPGIVHIGDPVPSTVSAERTPLSIADAEAAVAACNFETIRDQLRFLVSSSDQLDRDGHKIIAELSRLNRANTAYEAARRRYDEGQMDEAKTLLVLAEQTHCVDREKAVEDTIQKIERMNRAIARIDSAIETCNIPAMNSLRSQLEGQSHVLFVERGATLGALAQPSAIAIERSNSAEAAIAAGDLDQAANDLIEAEKQLAGFQDLPLCLGLRDRVVAQRAEVDRQVQMAARVDEAIAACSISDMTALSRTLETESGVLLTNKKTSLDAVNGPATTARSLRNDAKTPLIIGELDDAEGLLRQARQALDDIGDETICVVIRDDVTEQLDEIARIRSLIAEADQLILACAPVDLVGLSTRLESEAHNLLTSRHDVLQRMVAEVKVAEAGIKSANALYEDGELNEAESLATKTLEDLAAIAEFSLCEPLRAQLTRRLSEISDVRTKLADADNAIVACSVPAMQAEAAALEGATHTLLAAKRQTLLDIGQPVAEGSALNDGASEHYSAGRIDEAEKDLRTAARHLGPIESCDPLKEAIANRISLINRLRGALTLVDEAVAGCDIPAMTSMQKQLEGQSHPLLVDRLNKVVSINEPATAAERLRSEARTAFDSGDLSIARSAYRAAEKRLASIDSGICGEIRDKVTSQLATIGDIETMLGKVDTAVAACHLPNLRAVNEDLEGQSYLLLVRGKELVSNIIDPLATAEQSHEQAESLYQEGDLVRADTSQKVAAEALGRIDASLCPAIRQQVSVTGKQIATVRSILATADSAVAACNLGGLEDLTKTMSSVEHRLLRSKQAEVESFYRPIRAAINLGDAAKKQYFEGNMDIAEARLAEARRELTERPGCIAIFQQLERRVERIAKMRDKLDHVDRAVALCHILAMSSMSLQLEGQSHVLLQQKKSSLDRVMVPASTAGRRNHEAWPLFESGQLVAAQTRLEQALDQLDQIERIDRSLCVPLRREIENRLDEVDRVRSTLVLVDSALANCNHADIDLLLANLTNARHTSLVRAMQDLKAGRLRCGLSDDEKLAQAEQTCRRKHPNSIVDEFNPQTGRYTCVCPSDYMWDPENAACVSRLDVQEASNRVCSAGYPNSVAVHIRAPNQFECNCRDGYVWNEGETGCVSADVVVQNAVQVCARENGYPAEIEGAGRFTCCPNGTIWNRARRECVKGADSSGADSGGDPQCRWVASTGGAAREDYICTCDPEELCGPSPAETAVTEAPMSAPTLTTESALSGTETPASGMASPDATGTASEQPNDGFVDKIKGMFGNIF